MRFVSVRDLRAKSAEVWRDLEREREMVITSNGRPVAILAAVDEANLEASLRAFRRGRAMDALGTLQRGHLLLKPFLAGLELGQVGAGKLARCAAVGDHVGLAARQNGADRLADFIKLIQFCLE